MKHEVILPGMADRLEAPSRAGRDAQHREEAQLSGLSRSAAATLFRALALGMTIVLAAALATAYLTIAATGLPFNAPILTVVAASAATALLGIGVLSLVMGRAIAKVVVQPVNLLLPQLENPTSHEYRWDAGRPMNAKDLEADLRSLDRRARQAAARTRQMIGDLDRAREVANDQNLAKSQFLANMSHELRTPLNAILGYTMLLHEDAAEAKNASAMADLDRIQQAGRNLLGIINDILDLARLETGKTTVERSVIDLEGLLRSVAAGYQSEAARNGNLFSSQVAADTPIMIGDQGKIVQCLRHLVGNAFKFTTNGKVELRCSSFDHAGRRWVQFEVRDDGIGIDPAHQEDLFEAFHQIDGGARKQHGGAGFGLAIVRQLSHLMGGTCTVESQLGEGATFRLKLPAGDPAEAIKTVVRAENAREATSDFTETPSAEHTALVIDDDEAAIDLMRRWLARMGFNVLSTTDGATGLRLARTHRPDVILLDALLPDRSGYEMADDLRQDPETAGIPTILITVDDDRQRGMRSGASDYLRKPVSESQLREVLDVYRGRVAGDVLVIDDDDDSADLVARCVAQVGFSSRRAFDGIDGLAMASEKRPDAIVLDLAMPSMNGFEVIDHLSANPLLKTVPLIVVSGADITIEQHTRLAQAGLRFLPKAASTPREIAQSLKELVA